MSILTCRNLLLLFSHCCSINKISIFISVRFRFGTQTWPELWNIIDTLPWKTSIFGDTRFSTNNCINRMIILWRRQKVFILKCSELGLFSVVFINAFLAFDCTVCIFVGFCTHVSLCTTLFDFVFYINKREMIKPYGWLTLFTEAQTAETLKYIIKWTNIMPSK